MFKAGALLRWTRPVMVVPVLVFLLIAFRVSGQEMPPRPIAVGYLQTLDFGAFAINGSGGSVILTPYGSRSSVGGIILVGMGYPYHPAIFTLEGIPGTITHPLPGPDIVLNGSSGGTLTLHLGDVTPPDPIIINVEPPGQMQVYLGGTLLVGAIGTNPPGYYTGTFTMMFMQE